MSSSAVTSQPFDQFIQHQLWKFATNWTTFLWLGHTAACSNESRWRLAFCAGLLFPKSRSEPCCEMGTKFRTCIAGQLQARAYSWPKSRPRDLLLYHLGPLGSGPWHGQPQRQSLSKLRICNSQRCLLSATGTWYFRFLSMLMRLWPCESSCWPSLR